MPRVELRIEYGYSGVPDAVDIVDIPDGEWNAMTATQRQNELDNLWNTHVGNTINGGATVLDEDPE